MNQRPLVSCPEALPYHLVFVSSHTLTLNRLHLLSSWHSRIINGSYCSESNFQPALIHNYRIHLITGAV